jgi:4-hydroxy-2-oxoheptanedioate aldolase
MTGAPLAVEALGRSGVDFVGLDLQHGAFDYAEAAAGIQLLDALGVPAFVRVSHLDLPLLPRVLDMGASGVIVAMVEDAATVERAVKASRYQPWGDRSYGGQRYGMRPEPADLADVRPEIFAMVETRGALDAVEEIARVPGLAGLFVGPVDLALAVGEDASLSGELTSVYVAPKQGASVAHPLEQAEGHPWRLALARIRDAARAAGIEAGMFAVGGADAAYWGAFGFDRVVVASDVALLRGALEREVALGRGQGASQAPLAAER